MRRQRFDLVELAFSIGNQCLDKIEPVTRSHLPTLSLPQISVASAPGCVVFAPEIWRGSVGR